MSKPRPAGDEVGPTQKTTKDPMPSGAQDRLTIKPRRTRAERPRARSPFGRFFVVEIWRSITEASDGPHAKRELNGAANGATLFRVSGDCHRGRAGRGLVP